MASRSRTKSAERSESGSDILVRFSPREPLRAQRLLDLLRRIDCGSFYTCLPQGASFKDQLPGTSMNEAHLITAAVLVIGDEILSGRTQDVNVATIARFLAPFGIDLAEARFVPDVESEIVAAVNALRTRYSYVFTTGGIGPTHDDITADSIGAAFGLAVEHHPEAMALLSARYKPGEFNERRQRMARVPEGASLIKNPVSVAPGFQIG